MQNVDPKILDKIKKCLALATSSEPHEAAAAMRQAQKLMQMHGVSETALLQAEVGENRVEGKGRAPARWEASLFSSIGRAFGCRMYWSPRSRFTKSGSPRGDYVYIGAKAQAELAAYTADVLVRRLRKAIEAHKTEYKRMHPYAGRAYIVQAGDGFATGWVKAIAATIHDFANPEKVQSAIDLVMDERTGGNKVKKQSGSKRLDARSYQSGEQAAKGESLYRPVNARAPMPALRG